MGFQISNYISSVYSYYFDVECPNVPAKKTSFDEHLLARGNNDGVCDCTGYEY